MTSSTSLTTPWRRLLLAGLTSLSALLAPTAWSAEHVVRMLNAGTEGATPWLSALDQPFVVSLEREGLYFYNCPPHLMMGMVGLVQVGEAFNRSAATVVMKSTQGRVYGPGARIDALLTLVR